MDVPSHMRSVGYDAGVKAERERCLALAQRVMSEAVHDAQEYDDDGAYAIKADGRVAAAGEIINAIRDGLTVEEFEAKLSGGGDDD